MVASNLVTVKIKGRAEYFSVLPLSYNAFLLTLQNIHIKEKETWVTKTTIW